MRALRFTAAEQLAGWRKLQEKRPDLAEREPDAEVVDAWINCIEDAIAEDR